jgi:hypothetical protein
MASAGQSGVGIETGSFRRYGAALVSIVAAYLVNRI